MLSHKPYENQGICFVTIAHCYITKTFVARKKFLIWKWPTTLKRLGRPAIGGSKQMFGVKEQTNVWGREGFLPDFLKLARKNFGPFLYEYFLMKTIFGMKKSFMWFYTRWGGAIFKKTKHVGRHFCSYFQGVCPDFHRFCSDFRGFCRFSGILPGFSPHQNFWGCACIPASLHHWYR